MGTSFDLGYIYLMSARFAQVLSSAGGRAEGWLG